MSFVRKLTLAVVALMLVLIHPQAGSTARPARGYAQTATEEAPPPNPHEAGNRAILRAAVYAALIDQAKYDEAQRQKVARAVEETDDDGEADRTEPQYEGTCGGDLPPCSVKQRESGGDYSAVNETGCGGRTCGGAWQFDPNTWDGYGGYARAEDAPPEVQDQKAAELWDGGAGCGHWAAC